MGGFANLLPVLKKHFDIPEGKEVWPPAALNLAVGVCLFPMGRLCDKWYDHWVFAIGCATFVISTGSSIAVKHFVDLIVVRAIQGLGAAAILPSGISMLSHSFPPGREKNLVFGVYGAVGPIGFYLGILTGGLTEDKLDWRSFYIIATAATGIGGLVAFILCPRNDKKRKGLQWDIWGQLLMISGILLLLFSLTDSSRVLGSWKTPRTFASFICSLLLLAGFISVEWRVARHPLIPFSIFRHRFMKRMLLCLFLTWGTFSIYLFYSNMFIQEIMGKSAFVAAVWFTPWAVGGIIFAVFSSCILHCVPGHVLLTITSGSKIVAFAILAFTPAKGSYWRWIFPSMLAELACVDVLWTTSNVYLTNNLGEHQQGLAGALINFTLFTGCAIFLAFASWMEMLLRAHDTELDDGWIYRVIFLTNAAIASFVFLLCAFLLRLGIDEGKRPDQETGNENQPRGWRVLGASIKSKGLSLCSYCGCWVQQGESTAVDQSGTPGRTKDAV